MTDEASSTAPTLGSILVGSAQPDRLRAWYGAALDAEPKPDGLLDVGGVSLLIDGRADVALHNPEPGRLILSFHVDDARASAAHLRALGGSWLVELEDRRAGRFGTLIDPDGNFIQIIEVSADYDASRGR